MGEVGEKGMVCVTGGAGFLASWLIMRLLQHGYSVRTTVRSDPTEFKEDISHLKPLPGATEKLQIFEADLDKPESFNDAIDGCVGVFLVAHPIELEGKISQETIIKTSVEGTLGILKSCLKYKVKRVVYTSSVAAAKVIRNIKDIKEIDENIWTEVDIIRKCEGPTFTYAISKTLTERAALEFAAQNGLDLVTILPSMIVGPSITPNLSFSVSKALSLILDNEESNTIIKVSKLTNAVHIDDVVSAQIFLFESTKAKGRHICSSVDITIHDVAKFIAKKYPEYQLSTDLLREIKEEERPVHISSEKLLRLGFKFKYGFEDMFHDVIQSCKEKGHL